MKKNTLFLAASILSTSLLIGCGGGGGGGSASLAKATISTDNYETLAVAAAEGSKQAAESSTQDFSGLFKSNNNASFKSRIDQARQATDYVEQCYPSGSYTITIANENATTVNEAFDGATIVFNNCNDGVGLVNGTISNISVSENNTTEVFTFTATNLTAADVGINNFSGSVTCTYVIATDAETCTTGANATSNFSGDLDNRSYTVTGMQVSGNGTDGYNVNGTVNDPDHGAIDIVATGITFTCSGGQPGTGSITITGDAGATATVTFDDCTQFTVTFDGASTTVLWSSIL